MDNIQLTLESSTTSLSLNSDSIYLNPEIDGLAGLPEIRTTSGVNAGYNGGWTSAQFYDARLITIRGVISNSDISVVEDRRKALVGLLGQGRKEELTLHFVTAGGNSYVLNCRTISCEMALSGLARKQEFLIQLRADDPLIYDDGALATEAIVNVRRALGGFQIDFGLPLYIGGGVNETLVENGNETVYPVINLYGPLHSPTIINQTTNQQMQVLTDLDYTLTWVNPVEVTGDYILVTNETDKESPLSSVELLGNTTQDTLSGKNLLNYTTIQQTTKNGVSCSLGSDGTITLNGTCTADNTAFVFDNTNIYLDGTYTLSFWVLSGSVSNTTSDTAIRLYQAGYTQGLTVRLTNGPTGRNSGARSGTYVIGNIRVDSGVVFNNYQIRIQLEKNSERTDFEPYCGGVPSPNPDYPQTVQTTTGEQVVKMCGKNLFNVEAIPYVAKRAYGSDGSVLSWSNYTGTDGYQPVESNTEYTLWNNKTSDTTYICEYDENKTFIQRLVAKRTFTTTATTKYLRWSINVGGGGISPTQTQLELGSTASDFEPYQSQSYEVNLGKNLFDKDNAEIVHIYSGSNGTVANASAWSIILPCQPSAFYAYSNTNPTAMKADSSINFYATKPTEAGIAKIGSQVNLNKNATVTFTAPAGANWMLVYYRWNASDGPSAYAGMMIERGSKATDYAPYFTPIELCKLGTYQDKIYKSGDDWFVHREVGKYVLTSDVAITPQIDTSKTNTTRFQFTNILNEPNSTVGRTSLKCSHFKYKTNWGADVVGIQLPDYADESQNTRFWFRVLKTTATTFDELKTFLTDNPISLYYPLATPTDTQITNQALIDQLDALASSTLFVGVNNIALVPSGGAQGELSIDYFSAYTEDRDIVVIDSQARTITKNGADIYYLKADGSEFPTLAPGENTLYLTSEQTSDEGYAEIKFKQGYLSI